MKTDEIITDKKPTYEMNRGEEKLSVFSLRKNR